MRHCPALCFTRVVQRGESVPIIVAEQPASATRKEGEKPGEAEGPRFPEGRRSVASAHKPLRLQRLALRTHINKSSVKTLCVVVHRTNTE